MLFRDSNTLVTIGVKDIWLMSCSIEPGGYFLASGMTVADFHKLGRLPSLKELLNIAAIGAASGSSHIFETMHET